MGSFEFQTLCKGEIRSWLWLMAAVFATITLFQYTALLNGDFISSLFSHSKAHQQQQRKPKNDYFVADNNSTSINRPDAIANDAFPGFVNTSHDKESINLKKNRSSSEENIADDNTAPENSSVTLDGDDGDHDLVNGPSLVNTNRRKHSLVNSTSLEDIALDPGQNGNSTRSHESPSMSKPNTPLSSSPNKISPPPPHKRKKKKKTSAVKPLGREVYTLRDMDELLTEGHRSTHLTVPLWSSKADQELVYAKSEIENVHPLPKDTGLHGPLYRNVTRFHRSYELMEKTLKVYVYREGDRPVFHQPNLKGIYASEGWFMKHVESSKQFVTRNPKRAHLLYLPFSSDMLVSAFYVPNSHSRDNLVQYLKNYLDMIVAKYPFWNRTGGADHFLVSCHDWAPAETRLIMSTCIRALCNADVKEGFYFGKDVSLPETNVPNAKNPLRNLGGKPPSKRKTLAFFAGQMHGYLRPEFLKHWENVDPDMKIFGKLPHVRGNRNYVSYMQDSKYCICPRGYEVNSPRVVEAIFYECVPVIISNNFVPPLFETLNWESFSIFVAEKDVPRLKEILLAIPEKTYLRMYMRVKMVQRHFLWHPKRPVKYDLFHMILHSVWYNRVFQFRPQISS